MANHEFQSACDGIALLFADMWKPLKRTMRAFPARRHDESGWHIGYVLDGITLAHQAHIEIPPYKWDFSEDYLRALIESIPMESSLSALSPRTAPSEWQRRDIESAGFHLRFILMPRTNDIRVDVVVG